MGSENQESGEDFRFDYSKYKDTGPSIDDLKTLKEMATKSLSGNFLVRVMTLLTMIIFAILVWMIQKKVDFQYMVERQLYYRRRAQSNEDRVNDDDMSGRPRE